MPGDRFDLSAERYFDALGTTDANTPEQLANSLFTALSGGTLYNNLPVMKTPENIAVLNNTIGRPDFAQLYNQMLNQGDIDTAVPTLIPQLPRV